MFYHLESKLISCALFFMIVFGFVARVFPKVNNVIDILMLGMAFWAIGLVILNIHRLDSRQFIPFVILIALTLSFFLSVINNMKITSLFQYGLYVAYLAPLLFIHKVSPKSAYQITIIMIILGVMQLPVDLLFPRADVDLLDAYSGTFVIANNKSRFLYVIILTAIFFYKYAKPKFRLILLASIACMLWSFALGYSLFVYLFGVISLTLGLFYKNKVYALISAMVAFCMITAIFIIYVDTPVVKFTYHRYLDSDHGVFAIVKYAWNLLLETYFVGSGLGEFVSRASQSLGGIYTSDVPRTMITFGTIYEGTVAPGGLPSYVSLIAETGIIGLIITVLIVYYLYQNSHNSYLGFSLFVYIMLLTLYMPTFFEGPDGAVFLYAYMVINKALTYLEINNYELLDAVRVQKGG